MGPVMQRGIQGVDTIGTGREHDEKKAKEPAGSRAGPAGRMRLVISAAIPAFIAVVAALLLVITIGAAGGRLGCAEQATVSLTTESTPAPASGSSDGVADAEASVGSPPSSAGVETAEIGDVAWRELQFEARKLLLSATTTLKVSRRAAEEAAEQLRDAPTGEEIELVSPEVTYLQVATDLPFGRDELVTAWLSPVSGAVLQSEKLVTGSKCYWKLRRYTRDGFFQWRAEPERKAEERLSSESWSRRSQYLVPWDESPSGLAVTDSYALLFLMSAAGLDREGASMEVAIFSRKRVVSLRLDASQRRRMNVDLVQEWPGGRRRIDGAVMVREVRGSGRLVSGASADEDDVELGFLGMKGEIRVSLLEGSGIPVEVRGKTESFGSLTVRLKKVLLKEAPG